MMKFITKKSALKGNINIPSSKSHTLRALAFASLANGKSIIKMPLLSDDGLSGANTIEELGCTIEKGTDWIVSSAFEKSDKKININVGNSGTSLRLFSSIAALRDVDIQFDGDDSIRKRPMKPLLDSLEDFGLNKCEYLGEVGCCPYILKGGLKGGETTVSGVTSQFLSSLLIVSPLLENDSIIKVKDLNEKPYVDITLYWLNKFGIKFENLDYKEFRIPGKQSYKPFNSRVPADFSSAAFPLVAALICEGSDLILEGLDFADPQGDKKVFEILKKMGGDITINDNSVRVRYSKLTATDMDLNDIPDALPALAVAASFAKGRSLLGNVPQARIKETDRIAVMAEELSKMDIIVEELDDGLIIDGGTPISTNLSGHDDHRIVMALSIAGMAIKGSTSVDSANSAYVTYPNFDTEFSDIGASISKVN